MKKAFLVSALMAGTAMAVIPAEVYAKDLGGPLSKERFQIRARVIDVSPDVDSDVNIGGEVDADYAITPEVDVTYFFTPNIAVELIAATSKHDVDYTGGVDLGEAWVLPPTVMLQYHFTPDSKFSPYVGAGVNYSFFYAEDAADGFTDLNVDNGFGYGL